MTVTTLWRTLPVVVRAVVTGGAVATVGTVPWALLASANLAHWPNVPWAAPVTGVYLWLLWRYLRGEGWPASTAASRRALVRANDPPGELWGAALFAGMLGLAGVLLLQAVMGRMVRLP